jgi:hypothetical protein
MIVAQFSLADASIAQSANNGSSGKKAPPKRMARAMADQRTAPEPR